MMKMKDKVRISKPLRIAALVVVISVLGCCILFNGLYAPSCDLDQLILSSYEVHPKIPGVSTAIDLAPSSCYEGYAFVNQRTMQRIIMATGWDAHFCLGQAAIRTRFIQDAYGCGEHGGLIVIGPTLQMYVKNDGK